MNNKDKKDIIKSQGNIKNILTFISMLFLVLAYITYMKYNYSNISKILGIVCTFAIVPLIFQIVLFYIKARKNKNEKYLKRYKMYASLVIPIAIYTLLKYGHYYILNGMIDIKTCCMLTILISTGFIMYSKSLFGLAILQILNIVILSNYSFGQNYIYPIFSIIYIVFSLLYVINICSINLEKSNSKRKKEETIFIYLDKETRILKQDCIRLITALCIMIISYGVLKIIFGESINLISILLILGIFNIDAIKNRFNHFPKIYEILYESVLIFTITFLTVSNELIKTNFIMFLNLVLVVGLGYILIARSEYKKDNKHIFIMQNVLVLLPILALISNYLKIILYAFLITYLLINMFLRKKEYKYIIYILSVLLYIYLKIYVYGSIANTNVIEYLIVSGIFYIAFKFIKKKIQYYK